VALTQRNASFSESYAIRSSPVRLSSWPAAVFAPWSAPRAIWLCVVHYSFTARLSSLSELRRRTRVMANGGLPPSTWPVAVVACPRTRRLVHLGMSALRVPQADSAAYQAIQQVQLPSGLIRRLVLQMCARPLAAGVREHLPGV